MQRWIRWPELAPRCVGAPAQLDDQRLRRQHDTLNKAPHCAVHSQDAARVVRAAALLVRRSHCCDGLGRAPAADARKRSFPANKAAIRILLASAGLKRSIPLLTATMSSACNVARIRPDAACLMPSR